MELEAHPEKPLLQLSPIEGKTDGKTQWFTITSPGGQEVGLVALSQIQPYKPYYMEHLSIKPAFQNQGYAEATILEVLRQRGFTEVSSGVITHPAITKIWEKLVNKVTRKKRMKTGLLVSLKTTSTTKVKWNSSRSSITITFSRSSAAPIV